MTDKGATCCGIICFIIVIIITIAIFFVNWIIGLIVVGILIFTCLLIGSFSDSVTSTTPVHTDKPQKPYKPTPNYRNQYWLRRELASGRSISEIARNQGVLEDTIKKWVKHFGIQQPQKTVKQISPAIQISCPHCGYIYTEKVEICEKCGAKIKNLTNTVNNTWHILKDIAITHCKTCGRDLGVGKHEICPYCGANLNVPIVCEFCQRITKPILDYTGKQICEFCKKPIKNE